MKQNRKKTTKQGRSIFQTILSTILLTLCAEVLLLAGAFYFSKISAQLDQNAVDVLQNQVENRKSYLENTMLSAQNLTALAERINTTALELEEAGEIRIETLENSSEDVLPLMQAIGEDLIETLRNRPVNGIFVVFNTSDLNERADGDVLPCVYIRDLDPTSLSSDRNADLQFEYCPSQLVQDLRITTDRNWNSAIPYTEQDTKQLIFPAFQSAWSDSASLSAADYGHWTTSMFTLPGDNHAAIAYSIPLILPDGRVYGVLGVEMLESYLQTLLPSGELQNADVGGYMLACAQKSTDRYDTSPVHEIVTISGKKTSGATGRSLKLASSKYGGYRFQSEGTWYYGAAEKLSLYNRNAPFSDKQWLLMGMVSEQRLFAFSNHVVRLLMLCVLLTTLAGLASSILAARRLARPVSRLSKKLLSPAQTNRRSIPAMPSTGIRELDQFSAAITQLSRDVLDRSTKFLRIMEMASVELGGYELCSNPDSVYVTDNFFTLLGMPEEDPKTLTAEHFRALLKRLENEYPHKPGSNGAEVYRMTLPNGAERYLHIETTWEANAQVGLVEDVTAATMERLRIEHERDYDPLTGLYSRRAFQRECEALFAAPEKLGCAALIMMDLDDLKRTNDTFGHDWGDEYIRQTGQCFAKYAPKGSLCARISGDEFNMLLYGYSSQDEIRQIIVDIKRAVRETVIQLPSGRDLHISISGGLAWYPMDTTDLSTLKKYADFAMYQVKHTEKGQLGEFDLAVYSQDLYVTQSRNEFRRLISEELVRYHFQPLVSAYTGEVEAYEALMRVDLPTLHTPTAVMKLAREENCLHEIERITMFKASEAFLALGEKGIIQPNQLMFVNSIANQCLTEEEAAEFEERYSALMPRTVIEIVEEEDMDMAALERKKRFNNGSGVFALDDYGSGYNSEKCLLLLAPRYIKVDLSIIRDIDTDVDKQQLVLNLVDYAHKRDMKIVAEGLENAAELKKVLELGVDLLQGFYLARPMAEPAPVNPAALSVIAAFHNGRKNSDKQQN